jgi:hypothetical protein
MCGFYAIICLKINVAKAHLASRVPQSSLVLLFLSSVGVVSLKFHDAADDELKEKMSWMEKWWLSPSLMEILLVVFPLAELLRGEQSSLTTEKEYPLPFRSRSLSH